MKLNEIAFTDAVPIDSYGPGFFRVAGEVHHSPLFVLTSSLSPWGGFEDVDTLLAKADVLDVIFIGTGAEIAHIPAELRTTLEDAGLGVEIMSTPAACRTFNVLLSEGRRIAAALVPV